MSQYNISSCNAGGWGRLVSGVPDFQKTNLDAVSPPDTSSKLNSWWSQSSQALPKDSRKGFNSLVIFVSLELWKHRYACVFEGVHPDVWAVLFAIVSEGQLWCRSGAVGLQELYLPSQVVVV